MFTKTEDICPKFLADELLRLARLDRDWVQYKTLPDKLNGIHAMYTASSRQETWLKKLWQRGSDAFGMWSLSIWLVDGPKVFRPSLEQCQALEQIEVTLELSDYHQPYPTLLVDLPSVYAPLTNVICHRSTHLLSLSIFSTDHTNDIVTTISTDGRPIEVSLQRFDEDLSTLAAISCKALRVAINACLALVAYGNYTSYLYPKDVESDQRLAKEQTPRGERAKKRLVTAPQLVSFTNEVVLHRTEHRSDWDGDPTGREVKSHWRRGHWAMQPYGVGLSLRKRILRPPVLVRADKFIGETSSITTVYKPQTHKEN